MVQSFVLLALVSGVRVDGCNEKLTDENVDLGSYSFGFRL